MSVWMIPRIPRNKAPIAPIMMMKDNAVLDNSNNGEKRATIKIPAVTIVAACISAEIGVGPSSSHTLGPWRGAERFLKELHDEGIRINAMNPERTATPMREENFGKEPAESLLRPEYVATATLKTLLSKLTGEVISQTPAGGTNVNKGAAVTIVISKGTQFAYIPNIYSIEEAKAVKALQDLDLKVVVKKIGKKTVKKVTNITPKVGTKVKRGSTVTITVG